MTTYLLFDSSLRSPEMRHEIGEAVADPVVFIEHEGRRIVAAPRLEAELFSAREDVIDDFWSYDELGIEELVVDETIPDHLIEPELVHRAVARLGASSVVVPPHFKVGVADLLRGRGLDVIVDAAPWELRRRRKSPSELEGIERAQRAAELAMVTASRMLGEAEPTKDGRLRFEGEILTAELIREAMSAALLSQGAESEEILVQSGDACMHGHLPGSGSILPDQSCVIDCFPRERRIGSHTDMTRTFVPGTPSAELQKLHADCRAALDVALESLGPGRDDAYRNVAEYFHERGYPTRLHHKGSEPLGDGFYHALGHGVGLDVHEPPRLGRRSDKLLPGDVVAVEPGLYFEGIGGVRLEDTVLITDGGVKYFTDPYPYDLQP